MIMIYDAALTQYTPKAVPTWMRTENFEQLMFSKPQNFLYRLSRLFK